MHDTFRLGRIAGIRVGLNWSWLVVFALIVWSLAVAVFPSEDPGLARGAYIGMGIAAALLFFLSLFLHELGHALVARREGVEIEGITLWLFGGVARFRGMLPSAGAEFRIAIAGPVVSALLGGAFVAFALGTHFSKPVDGVAAWLGYINLLLLAFNMLPALPLDGGRVFRSLLWKARGNFGWATGVAAAVGRGFGLLMIAAGVFLFIFDGAFTGAWLAFLGWFLLTAASAEARFVSARAALAGLTVGDLMTRDPVAARADESIGQFMDEVAGQGRHTAYPVAADGRPVGMLLFGDVAGIPRREWDRQEVRDCMLPRDEIPVFGEEDEAVEALTRLSASHIQEGIVVRGERLLGLLSLSDIARALGEDGGVRKGWAAAPSRHRRSARHAA